jgi:hypothetical protein
MRRTRLSVGAAPAGLPSAMQTGAPSEIPSDVPSAIPTGHSACTSSRAKASASASTWERYAPRTQNASSGHCMNIVHAPALRCGRSRDTLSPAAVVALRAAAPRRRARTGRAVAPMQCGRSARAWQGRPGQGAVSSLQPHDGPAAAHDMQLRLRAVHGCHEPSLKSPRHVTSTKPAASRCAVAVCGTAPVAADGVAELVQSVSDQNVMSARISAAPLLPENPKWLSRSFAVVWFGSFVRADAWVFALVCACGCFLVCVHVRVPVCVCACV